MNVAYFAAFQGDFWTESILQVEIVIVRVSVELLQLWVKASVGWVSFSSFLYQPLWWHSCVLFTWWFKSFKTMLASGSFKVALHDDVVQPLAVPF